MYNLVYVSYVCFLCRSVYFVDYTRRRLVLVFKAWMYVVLIIKRMVGFNGHVSSGASRRQIYDITCSCTTMQSRGSLNSGVSILGRISVWSLRILSASHLSMNFVPSRPCTSTCAGQLKKGSVAFIIIISILHIHKYQKYEMLYLHAIRICKKCTYICTSETCMYVQLQHIIFILYRVG